MVQSVRNTFFEIKELVFGGHSTEIDIEGYAVELSKRSILTFDDVKNAYNNLVEVKKFVDNPNLNHSGKRIWEKCEDNLIFDYVHLSLQEPNGNKKKSVSVALQEFIGLIPDRTETSVPYRYYNQNDDRKVTKAYRKRKVATKTITDKPKMKALAIEPSPIEEPVKQENDLLDMMVDIVDNLDTAEVDVESLFKGILTLSQKAVVSSNMGAVKRLEGQISNLENTLGEERSKNRELKKKNEELEQEISVIVQEFKAIKDLINSFNNLSGKQKIKQINSFNQRMKYMVDQSNMVTAIM